MVEAVTSNTEIDTDLYSRQIGTFGLETMGKLVKMKVLIIGCRGLGVETAKNLILAGPAQCDVFDPMPVAIEDLGANFYLKPEDVGTKTRAEASIVQLKELNPYVKVNVLKPEEFSEDTPKTYNVIVCTENMAGLGKLKELNEACRANKCGFISTQTYGPSGYIFLDYGTDHIITDDNGEQTEQFIVTHISQDEKGKVTVHEDKRHTFQDGDYVKFVEVEGMTEINNREPIEIEVTGSTTFNLKLDTTGLGSYTGQGVVEDVKVPKKVAYSSLKESIEDPAAATPYGFLEPLNMSHFGLQRSEQLHLAFYATMKFHDGKQRYPDPSEVEAVKAIAREINAAWKAADKPCIEEIDDKIIENVASFAKCSISPMAAFFGGIVAQEIVKFTGKYTPLKQWMHYDIFEAIPDGELNREPTGSRYDDQIRVFGRELQEKLGNVKTFMIGAGALGCELAKAFALMGVGCGPEGKITVTDNDNIEVSNLNRQFLFRKNNVGKPKSETACMIAQSMNSDLKINPLTQLVMPDTENIFTDEFWDGLDFVVNAVDNIKARLYIDKKCAWHLKPLLESGTLGTKANSQMVVPNVTQCYGDSTDPPEKDIPLCTLRSFPTLIDHCIEWGRDRFETLFAQRVQDAISLIKDADGWLAESKKSEGPVEIAEKLENAQQLLTLFKNKTLELCVQEARNIFDANYDHAIRDLLALFPADSKDSHGNPFWSGPKRLPVVIGFDASDPIHFAYVLNTANLIAVNLGIEPERDQSAIAELIAKTTPVPYVKKDIKVETPEESKENEDADAQPAVAEIGEEDEAKFNKLVDDIKALAQGLTGEEISAAEFEKDDDKNFHIDFINACSNLRARNYRIGECDRNKTKMIAGKIIPAIATATAMITGAVTTELYKFAQGMTKIESFKNAFINLALPQVQFTEPAEIKRQKAEYFSNELGCTVKSVPEKWSSFDKIVVNEGSLTVQQLLDWLVANYSVEAMSVNENTNVTIYSAAYPSHASRTGQKIEDIYGQESGKVIHESKNYLILSADGDIKDTMDAAIMPPIKYIFR